MTSPKTFFILGCQRTGTTLMRLILESHSKISCVDEHRAYEILSDKKLLNEELEKNQRKDWLCFKTPRITEQMTEPFLADIGINFRTQNNYKGSPIVFMNRNVLDTVASMKTLDQEGIIWLERWGKKTIDFWCDTTPGFKKLFKKELQVLEKAKHKQSVAGAIYWKYKTLACFNYESDSIPIIKIRYEDLVNNKKTIINQVLDFLKLDWEDSVLSHEKIPHAETDSEGITVGNNDTKIPINAASVNRYKKLLQKNEVAEILDVTRDLMTKLNYNVNNVE